MSKTRIKTYDRIIQESLKLFNEQGERSITTNHIAAHLGISPGNLYYHFRNKEEIVYQIFTMYREFINQRLAVPEDRKMTVDDLVNYLDTAFLAMWQFRFMFYDLPGMLARNPQMQSEYHQFVNTELKNILGEHFREFIRLGLLKMDEEDIEGVSINIWLVVKFWFAFEQTSRPRRRSPRSPATAACCRCWRCSSPMCSRNTCTPSARCTRDTPSDMPIHGRKKATRESGFFVSAQTRSSRGGRPLQQVAVQLAAGQQLAQMAARGRTGILQLLPGAARDLAVGAHFHLHFQRPQAGLPVRIHRLQRNGQPIAAVAGINIKQAKEAKVIADIGIIRVKSTRSYGLRNQHFRKSRSHGIYPEGFPSNKLLDYFVLRRRRS